MVRRGISKGTRFAILNRDGFRCRYCGAEGSESKLQIDHVVPVVDGGSNDETNLVTSCQPCNSGKAARSIDRRHPRGHEVQVLFEAWEQIYGSRPDDLRRFLVERVVAYDPIFVIDKMRESVTDPRYRHGDLLLLLGADEYSATEPGARDEDDLAPISLAYPVGGWIAKAARAMRPFLVELPPIDAEPVY